MKKRSIVYATVVIAIIIAISTYASMIPRENGGSGTLGRDATVPRFHLKTDFPTIDSSVVNVYKIVPDYFNSSRFMSIGMKFGLTGEPEFVDNDVFPSTYIITGDDGKLLRYHMQTGVWRYISNEAYPTVYEEPNLPNDSEAVGIAESFLKENGFWSDDIAFSKVRYQTQSTHLKETGEVIDEWVIAKEVYFGKQLDNLVIIGDKASVTIIGGGSVAAFTQSTRAFQTIGNASLITPEKAFENLQEGKGIRCRCRTVYADRDIDIENIYLCYYIDSILEDTGPIVPCYAFEGKFCDDGEGFSTFVNAIEG